MTLKNLSRTIVIAATIPLIAACTTFRETEPKETATQQLLFSTAVDRVADALSLRIPEKGRVYVDASYLDVPANKYLVATIRDRILRTGGRLVQERVDADLVIEPRVGALSIDRKTTLVGLPSIPVPIPLAGQIELPEIALLKRDRQQGVLKLAIASYDAKTGVLHQSVDPVYTFSKRTDWIAMIFFGWQNNDLMSGSAADGWVGGSTFD